MRHLILFLLVFGAALFGGTLLAWPVHLLTGIFTAPDFSSSVKLATQMSGLIFSMYYLRYADRLDLRTLGIQTDPTIWPRIIASFGAGLFIFAILAAGLFAFGLYGTHTGRVITAGSLFQLLSGALLTGFGVAVFEEIVFRGALLQGLCKRSGMLPALITVSFVYAAVHFIHFPAPDNDMVGWLTAPALFITVYTNLLSMQTVDALLTLFVLGLLFGYIRIRTGNIILCIGLHAGIVAGVKVFRYFAEYRPDNSFPWLVSTYDLRLGWLALIWLTLVLITYWLYQHRHHPR